MGQQATRLDIINQTAGKDMLTTKDLTNLLNNQRAEFDAKLKQPLTTLQKIDRKQTQLTNRSNKLEHVSANSNIIASNFILKNFINSFFGAVQCPNFNAYKQWISNSRELAELYIKVEHKQLSS